MLKLSNNIEGISRLLWSPFVSESLMENFEVGYIGSDGYKKK